MGLIGDVLIAVAIAVGLVGIIVPVLPGTVLILAAIVVWAVVEGGAAAWTTCAIAVAILGAAQALKYAVPGRRLQVHGVPGSSLVVAGVLAIVGFFVLPVVGLVVGFVAGVYLAEAARLQDARRALASTSVALRAVGLAIVIELAGGLLASAAWLTGVIVAA
jgi:uncharacterized protein YqgC (DUF456 family)